MKAMVEKILPILILSVSIITGCGATVDLVAGPDGTATPLITCDEASECYNKAAEFCKGKYTVINSSVGGLGVHSWQQMLVRCN